MNRSTVPRRLTLLTLLTLLPQGAHAYGGYDVQVMFLSIIEKFWPLWITAAVLVLVIAGFSLMISQDEGKLEKAKSTIIAVIIGGIITTIIIVMGPKNFISLMYNGTYGFTVVNTGDIIGAEAIGISQWLMTIAIMLGVLFVIIGVIRAVASIGEESAYTNARLQLLHVVVGIVIIAGAYLIQLAFFGSPDGPGQVVTNALNIEPNPLIGLISQKLFIVLNFITLIAVVILMFAGIRMIVSFGREEEYTAAKGLLFRVLIGIFVILISYSLVYIVASIFA